MSNVSPSLFDEALSSERSTSKQDAILAAASRAFIQYGFEGTSMDLIAKAAGVARQTLYNRFPDGKEALFGAVAERMWRAFPVMDIANDEAALADPEAGLRTIGRGVAAFWAPPLAVAFLRMVIADGPRFPELTRRFFEVGKTPAVSAVRNYIAELSRRGKLSIEDPELASQQFLGMIDETVLWVRIMGDPRELSAAKTDKVVDQAVAIFLQFYRL
ncbi:Transcriptional regulator, AcrR family [Pseudomonas chlororaphis]|uniref:Transcriptional regulator, AcrR family n=1 Tax=Pseudomonas chlororaphis TaxID=587753 RepID=A0A3G7TZ71_9PSED|nr:TetR/AcrR family transcriptional regulator [Pseudomonas chlororaphis]AZE52171.1 Transcriptional regulator, AcrR family [Pseudomonas chlororaphis]